MCAARDNPYVRPQKLRFRPPTELTVERAREQMEQLVQAIRFHDRRYYLADDPVISDGQYDRLLARLQELERAWPQLLLLDSPTQRVSGSVAGSLPEVEHVAPLLSLASSGNADAIREFDVRVRKGLEVEGLVYVAEPKFDGLSIELVYRDGRFERAATRGDGHRGEDVTDNVRTIRSLPMQLLGDRDPVPELLAVRGEVLIPLAGFHAMNRARIERDQGSFANPRNAAAGAIRQLDSTVAARRPLDLFVYDLLATQGSRAPATHWETLDWLRSMGLQVTDRIRRCNGIEEAIAYHSDLQAQRDDLPYEIDGVVIKVDRRDQQLALGTRSRNPRWAVAHKFAPREEVTRVEDIALQVGRTGIIAPVALLAPVEVGGVTISRASLHNYDQVRDKDIRPGDTVRVHRAGDVIPYVVARVDERADSERAAPFEMPAVCPVCGSHVERDGAYFVCTGGIVCAAQLNGAIEHWASRHALDIEGLGSKTVRQLTEGELVTESVADLYRLRVEQLLPLELFGEVKANNLIDAIAASKNTTLGRFIYALGIRHVGEHVAEVLAREFGDLRELMKAPEERLLEVKEVGPQVSHNVRAFFAWPRNLRVVKELLALGVVPMAEGHGEEVFEAERFVITGSLAGASRLQISGLLERLGARVTASVSAKTDFVIVGENPGSKAAKARDLGVRILSESEFQQLLRERGVKEVFEASDND